MNQMACIRHLNLDTQARALESLESPTWRETGDDGDEVFVKSKSVQSRQCESLRPLTTTASIINFNFEYGE